MNEKQLLKLLKTEKSEEKRTELKRKYFMKLKLKKEVLRIKISKCKIKEIFEFDGKTYMVEDIIKGRDYIEYIYYWIERPNKAEVLFHKRSMAITDDGEVYYQDLN